MEFPAVGYRYAGGLLQLAGTWGLYWSSVTNTSYSGGAYSLSFNNSDLTVGNDSKQYGRSVRCVR
ncbi:MAG: fibrobacter succinogenes major paralogous domain-containing protein [Rikenellaceae bacterium]|nr:fibrobacter succinogenes major paralogous domain-containing protein [Rikenellaceae bacterium]